MGSSVSREDRERRQNLEGELKKMEHSLYVTAKAHYFSSEFYSAWDMKLQYASYLTGMLGTSGGVLSKLGWKTIAQNYPRLGPLAAATAATMSLFAVAVNIPSLPRSPGALHQLHFKAGIECQYLERRVRFFAKTDLWNTDIPWTTLASRYENLLKEKKEVNGKIQLQAWAYRVALERIEMRRKEKEIQETCQTRTTRVDPLVDPTIL
ncbi:uncharacterized protein [Montipora capricornis]|uniref:uncharacterized protein n=1 Tax=Montipora capricornis TaxID=246305 RepID=UPI0035F14AC0